MSKFPDLFFAAVGDVHGDMHLMVKLLHSWEEQTGQQLAFVLRVGDFEPQRNEADLITTPGPKKYRKLGDFADFYTGLGHQISRSNFVADICCLANVKQGKDAIAIFQLSPAGQLVEEPKI